jgi:hypothetical protein
MLSLALLYSSPTVTKKLSLSSSTRDLIFGFASLLCSVAAFSIVPKLPRLRTIDLAVGAVLCYGQCGPLGAYTDLL